MNQFSKDLIHSKAKKAPLEGRYGAKWVYFKARVNQSGEE